MISRSKPRWPCALPFKDRSECVLWPLQLTAEIAQAASLQDEQYLILMYLHSMQLTPLAPPHLYFPNPSNSLQLTVPLALSPPLPTPPPTPAASVATMCCWISAACVAKMHLHMLTSRGKCRLRNEEALLMKNKRIGSGDVGKPGKAGSRANAGSSGRPDPTRPRRSTNDAPTPSLPSLGNPSSSSSSRCAA